MKKTDIFNDSALVTDENANVSGKMDYYVYALLSPQDNIIFYIGKGKNGRIMDHVEEAKRNLQKQNVRSDKVEKILSILLDKKQVKFVILRSGLSEQAAYQLEGMMIDFLTCKDYDFSKIAELKNIQSGHNDDTNGMMTFDDMQRIANAKPAQILDNEHLLAISINGSFFKTGRNVYKAVRSSWKIDIKHAQNANYVLAVFQGVIVGIYKNMKWYKANQPNSNAPARYEFTADEVTVGDVYNRLYYRIWELGYGNGNPIRYNY